MEPLKPGQVRAQHLTSQNVHGVWSNAYSWFCTDFDLRGNSYFDLKMFCAVDFNFKSVWKLFYQKYVCRTTQIRAELYGWRRQTAGCFVSVSEAEVGVTEHLAGPICQDMSSPSAINGVDVCVAVSSAAAVTICCCCGDYLATRREQQFRQWQLLIVVHAIQQKHRQVNNRHHIYFRTQSAWITAVLRLNKHYLKATREVKKS